MTEYFKDRIVQNPGRVVLTPVPGETNTYDMERAEGTVTEAGTPFNAATFNGIANAVHGYATCATAAGTAAKVATCSGFVLYAGASVTVRFNYANTSTSATLNVNGTGAYPIRALSATGTAPVNFWKAREAVTFVYDGTYWLIVDGGRYSPPGRVWYGTCPTAAGGSGANPKIVTVEDGFQLVTGATIAVKFDNAAITQPGQARSLQVNGTTAAPVMAGGVTAYDQQLWDAGDVVLFVYDGTNWQMASSPRGRLNPSTSWSNITTGTHNQTWAYREGNVVNLRVAVQNSSSVATGSNLFVGTLATESLRPVAAANSVAYVGSAAVVGILTPAGVLTARVTGATVAASTAAYLAFTYLAG